MKCDKTKEGYLIHQNNGEFILCKIIEVFNNEEDATNKLVEILTFPKRDTNNI